MHLCLIWYGDILVLYSLLGFVLVACRGLSDRALLIGATILVLFPILGYALTWAMQERADIISMSLGFDFPGMVAGLTADGWPVDLATSTALEAYRGNLRMFDAIMAVVKAQ